MGNNYVNLAGTHCMPCNATCNGRNASDAKFCTACATNYLLVTDVPGKCVPACSNQGLNYYEDNGKC